MIESPFAALRLRTDAAKRFKKVANATAVVWKMLLLAERKFRRINSSAYCRPAPPGSSITTAYRSEETNTRWPPPDLFTHLFDGTSRQVRGVPLPALRLVLEAAQIDPPVSTSVGYQVDLEEARRR